MTCLEAILNPSKVIYLIIHSLFMPWTTSQAQDDFNNKNKQIFLIRLKISPFQSNQRQM